MRGDNTKLVAHQHRLLEERQSAAAQLGMHMYGFRVILKNTFATEDLDTIINQLVSRSQGNLQQFIADRDLFVRMVGEIMTEFNLQQPPFTQSPQDSGTQRPEDNNADNKWVRIFWDKRPLDHLTKISGGIMTCEPWFFGCGVLGLLCVLFVSVY